jgi:hypothetical protein
LQANDLPFGLTPISIGFFTLKFFFQNTIVIKHVPRYSETQVAYRRCVNVHTSLSSRKSFSKLGECCRKKTSGSKSAAIDHSPRDKVFRLLKLGQLFSSLVRITFIA